MKNRTVIAYKNYFEDFLSSQTPKVQKKILQILRVIEEVEVIPGNMRLMREYYYEKNGKQ